MFSVVSSMPCRELPEHERDNMYLRLGTLPSWCFVLVRTYSYVVADGRPVTFHTVHYEKINILHRFKRKYIMLNKYVLHKVSKSSDYSWVKLNQNRKDTQPTAADKRYAELNLNKNGS